MKREYIDRVESLTCAVEQMEELVIQLRHAQYRDSSEAETKKILSAAQKNQKQ